MPFPDLQPRILVDSATGVSTIWAEAIGVPDDGENTFGIPFIDAGIPFATIDPDWLRVDVTFLGASILGYSEGSPLLSPTKQDMTLNFAQTGAGQARVIVQVMHSENR